MAKASEHRASELRKMSDEQLAVELEETTDHFFRLRLLSQTERLDAPSELRRHRRLIARIKTVQNERERAAGVKAQQTEDEPDRAVSG